MTYEDIDLMIADIADTLKCGYSFYTNDEAKVVKTPFLLFDYPNRDDLSADDVNYVKKENVSIEYDSAFRDLDSETLIESKLTEYGIFYYKQAAYIQGENAYETIYQFQVIIQDSNPEEGENQNG